MSSFKVGDLTINRIIGFLYYGKQDFNNYYKTQIREKLKKLGYDFNKIDEELDKKLKKIGEDLIYLNSISFYTQYSPYCPNKNINIKELAQKDKDFILDENNASNNLNLVQIVKVINSYLYQIEGVFMKDKFYLFLEWLVKILNSFIVHNLKEYEDFEGWGE